ncbi:MAG: UDP-N-acetylmuramoyl-tripeptide--D-alanyl-D-alanine ligase [Gammaproteobacteria bacterium]|nr:UDP-N-acetylmuramoyl-tripeptide--D-alanyl-D-alanine ligase [Gammaproteobacteria bacterium]
MKSTLRKFAQICGGTLIGDDIKFNGLSTDTRKISKGELFIALKGPNFNGARFLDKAASNGAVGALVESGSFANLPIIVVPNVLDSLQLAAKFIRQTVDIPVIGIAGSNGKTTCKEMLASILAQHGNTLSTRGNLNNHIGVPLTLLQLTLEHRYAVIEMGANRSGDITELVGILAPTIGLVTNAGAEHLEGFGSIEGAARAEGELFCALDRECFAILNVDDIFAGMWRDMTIARVVTFGLGAKADFSAREIYTSVGVQGFLTHFTLVTPNGEIAIELHLAGKHNVINAIGAAAAAMTAGASLKSVALGLALMRPVTGRLNLCPAPNGAWLIDDSYNANPSSMHVAIDVLAGLEGRRWLVIGDMAELGEFAAEAHIQTGHYAREHGVERVFAIGALAGLAAKSFGEQGESFDDVESLIYALAKGISSDVRVLIKGSRINHLEHVVEALLSMQPSLRSA